MEIGGQGEEIPSGLPCPVCPSKPSGRLRKHAYYLRSFKSFKSVNGNGKIKITRLRCSKCKKSFACLFPCIVPHSSYSAEALGELVTPYFFEDKSCEQIGWEASGEEGEGHRHLVHRLVEGLCQKEDWIAGVAEKQVLKQGESLWRRKEPEPEEACGNVGRVRSQKKRAALNRVKTALMKFRDSTGQALEAIISLLHELSMELRAPFSLLSQAKEVLVRTTHKRGNALF